MVLWLFFFKQKTAYEMRISDWSSDVCSSDLLAFGTIDSFLLWRLTGGRVHATDATNAARTLLYDIGRQIWDPELLALLRIPESLLPEVKDSDADFGSTEAALLGRSEEHTSELQSLMRISYAVFCLKKKNKIKHYRLAVHIMTIELLYAWHTI